MFVADEFVVDLGFRTVEARLSGMIQDGSLATASEGAYSDGLTAPGARPGHCGAALDLPELAPDLASVRCRELVTRNGSAVLALRWEAIGPGGRLLPTLDADLTLTPEGKHATRLSLAAAYRPSYAGALAGDAAVRSPAVRSAAQATARSLLYRVGGALAGL